MTRRAGVALGALSLAFACRPDATVEAGARTASSERDLLDAGTRYLDDANWRREVLEASLTSRTNLYARRRLQNYALAQGGWDDLPVWNPRVQELRVGAGGRPELVGEARRIYAGERPSTLAAWSALGEQVFFSFPLRPEPELAFAIEDPARAAAYGFSPAPDGRWLGVVSFEALDGSTRVGITCALCHVQTRDEAVVVGAARRNFDYGALRLAYRAAQGEPASEDLHMRMSNWGPGRADVSDDEDEDPVSIPDLWGLAQLGYLTQAGTLRQVDPATLAIRQETQILYASRQRVRPPRELAFALVVYLYGLAPPPPAALKGQERGATGQAAIERGQALFVERCAGCHQGPTGSGPLIDAAVVGTSPAMTLGRARGTGHYRPAPLIDVANAAPYLHDASIGGLDELLSPERFAADYVVGLLDAGPVEGHAFGTELSRDERDAIVAYLKTR